MTDDNYNFEVSIETNDRTGAIVAVYFQVRKGKPAKTVEYADGACFADYDRKGRLLGIELLEPCQTRVLDRIAKHAPAKRFVRRNIPVGMVASGG